MQRRRLGLTDLELPVVVYGAMTFGEPRVGPQRIATIHAAIDAGIDAIDTAPLYDFGRNEVLVGEAIRGRKVVILTKVGLRWDDPHGDILFEFTDDSGARRQCRKNSRPDSVRFEVEQSLSRLGVEPLDLVQVHHPDRHTPIADTMGTLLELRREGKVRHIGVSNYTASMIAEAQRALGDVPLASDQARYSLVHLDAEHWLLPRTRVAAVGVLAYSPLEQGLLSGKVSPQSAQKDGRGQKASFQSVNLHAVNTALSTVVRPIAERHRATAAQIVLAWTFGEPGITAVIAGASSPDQARENARAGEIVLDVSERRAIREAFLPLQMPDDVPVYGWRRMLRRVFRR